VIDRLIPILSVTAVATLDCAVVVFYFWMIVCSIILIGVVVLAFDDAPPVDDHFLDYPSSCRGGSGFDGPVDNHLFDYPSSWRGVSGFDAPVDDHFFYYSSTWHGGSSFDAPVHVPSFNYPSYCWCGGGLLFIVLLVLGLLSQVQPA
jgi:hypothetical protein